jgi:SNF2 family DNA or RNA helicase
MIENQAIARVLRLGQTRDVRVVRYIMKGTVEEVGYPLARLRRYKLTMVVGDANSAVTKARVRQSGVER